MDSSPQRFCIAADRVSGFTGSTAADGVQSAFDTLDAVAGERFSEHTSQWSLVFDTGAKRAFFRTHADQTLRWVDLDAFDPWCGGAVQMLDVHTPLAGDVTRSFHDYSHAEVRDQLMWFMDFWSVNITPDGVDALLRHFESFPCEPPQLVRRGTRRVRPDP
jgi:hypothetical protein